MLTQYHEPLCDNQVPPHQGRTIAPEPNAFFHIVCRKSHVMVSYENGTKEGRRNVPALPYDTSHVISVEPLGKRYNLGLGWAV